MSNALIVFAVSYVVVTIYVFVIVSAEANVPFSDARKRKTTARTAFAAPLWPVIGAVLLVRKTKDLWYEPDWKNERGSAVAEYALLIAGVTFVIVAAVHILLNIINFGVSQF